MRTARASQKYSNFDTTGLIETSLKAIEVSEPQNSILESTKQFNLFLAGVGSGKSHLMGIISANFVINFPEATGLICANTYSQLSASTLLRIYAVWSEYFGMVQDINFVVDKQPPENYKTAGRTKLKSYKNVISFQNGARIFLASLDNYTAVDGLQVSWAQLDETKDTKEVAVKEVVIARLRENMIFIDKKGDLWDYEPDDVKVEGFNPLYIFTSPAKVQWLNNMFFINDHLDEITSKIMSETTFYEGEFPDRKVVISSTYHNEHNLPSNYISSRKGIWSDTPGLVDMMIYASPSGKTGGEWYSNYDREVHVKKGLVIDTDLPIHLTLDFNVNPYMSGLIAQFIYGETDDGDTTITISILKEYALEHPKNTTMDLCNDVLFDYAGVVGAIYYYGDATGNNRGTATTNRDVRTNYDVVRLILADFLFEGSNRVPASNPRVAGRRPLMNRIFAGNTHVTIEIDEKCVHLIADIDNGKEGPNGEYLKPKFKDKDKGGSYEKWGHHSDCLVYLCDKEFNYLTKIQ